MSPRFDILCLHRNHHGIGVLPYSPIARGLPTGKYLPGAQQLQGHAEARGVTLAQFATAWVLANRMVSAGIAGPRTLAQWESYLPALDCTITADDEALIDGLVAPGHQSTPGFNDPVYPLIGRRTAVR